MNRFLLISLLLSNFIMAEFKDLELVFNKSSIAGRDLQSQSGHLGSFRQPPRSDGSQLIFENGNFLLINELSETNLPKDTLSLETVVNLRKTEKWGGITGYFQDNGSFEKGFLLGYNESKFFLAVSTKGKLEYVYSTENISLNKTYHLAATFGSGKMNLYVNGILSSTKAINGEIDYAKSEFCIGSYKDDNENYPMEGSLYCVKMTSKLLNAAEISKRANSFSRLIPQKMTFKQVPIIRFLSPAKAEICWVLPFEAECRLVPADKQRTVLSSRGKVHKLIIDHLGHNRVYSYKITAKSQSGNFESDSFKVENTINYSRQPLPTITPGQKAKTLLKSTRTKGLVALFGSGSDKLAVELAANSDLLIKIFTTDAKQAAIWRMSLYKQKLYGSRVTVYQADAFTDLPVTSNTFNFIYSEGQLKSQDAQIIHKWIKPGGFMASNKSLFAGRDFKTAKLGSLSAVLKKTNSSMKNWTAQYGNGGNTSYVGEELNGIDSTKELSLQWIGRPGADFGIDRNPRMPAPLAADGRLFHQGMNRLAAIDSFNGTILWTLEIPHLRRVNIPRDASNWCTDGKALYVAVENQILVISCKNGVVRGTLPLPARFGDHEWGYIGQEEDRLYGSYTLKKSQYKEFWTGKRWYDKIQDENTAKVCSPAFFAVSKKNGRLLWTYEKGLIINTTISFHKNRVYFIESRHPDLRKQRSSKISDAKLWEQQYLVGLDAKTGRRLFEKSIDTVDGNVVFYMQVSDEGIFVTGSNSKTKKYHLNKFSLSSGKNVWETANNWPADHHSGHMQHPVIIDETIYLEPFAYSVKTGKNLFKGIGTREGCHTYVGFKNGLLFRGTSRQVSIWSKENKKTTTWKRLRPSCWLSMLPSNGMVLVPEGGGGCSCGGWMETSLGFTPWEVK